MFKPQCICGGGGRGVGGLRCIYLNTHKRFLIQFSDVINIRTGDGPAFLFLDTNTETSTIRKYQYLRTHPIMSTKLKRFFCCCFFNSDTLPS